MTSLAGKEIRHVCLCANLWPFQQAAILISSGQIYPATHTALLWYLRGVSLCQYSPPGSMQENKKTEPRTAAIVLSLTPPQFARDEHMDQP